MQADALLDVRERLGPGGEDEGDGDGNRDRLKTNCAPRASLQTSTTRFWSGDKITLRKKILPLSIDTRDIYLRGKRER